MTRIVLVLAGIVMLACPAARGIDVLSDYGVRIKDIALVEGARPNQLRGIGLVTGLGRTGDNSENSIASLMLRGVLRSNEIIPTAELTGLSVNNAAVMVYAEIPPFVKPGTKLDVQVTAIGGSESLQGGYLLQTPLKGADGHAYAVAQGALTTGTFEFGGRAARVTRGLSSTVATLPQGAIVEEEIPVTLVRNQYLYLSLKNPDFTTAVRMADAINAVPLFKEGFPRKPAAPIDAASVRVEIPQNYKDETALVRLIHQIEGMYVEPDQIARVVVNERTGTIVIGEHVRISMVAVAHGGLNVAVTETPEVVQPGPFAEAGETKTAERTGVEVEEQAGRAHVLKGGVTVSELASALNALGASSRDIIAILQAIKAAGALQAELVVQ
jgi:flagellar P-ring protein precursor FlgI